VQPLPIRLAADQLLQLQGQIRILAQGGEALGEAGLLGLLEQRLPRPLGLDLVGVLEQPLQAPPFADQRGAALFADSLDARDVVAGIADQSP
jgi:hypothetical protein